MRTVRNGNHLELHTSKSDSDLSQYSLEDMKRDIKRLEYDMSQMSIMQLDYEECLRRVKWALTTVSLLVSLLFVFVLT